MWGAGTEFPSGFNQFLKHIDRLGTGAMELHAMHLKSIGAIMARTLSYQACEFDMIDGVSDPKVRGTYNKATELWTDLHAQLADRLIVLREREEVFNDIDRIRQNDGTLSEEQLFHIELHADSDDEDGLDSDDEDVAVVEQRRLRRMYRNRQPKHVRGQFWSSHQRFFRSLCIASKVDKAIEIAKRSVDEEGKCCVIGLQTTGEAQSKSAQLTSGLSDGGALDEFVSAPNEDLKKVIMQMFPLP